MIAPRERVAPGAVGRHYDALDRWYRELWGEHLHHGLWESGRESPEEAVLRLVDRVADLARIGPGSRVVDVGCGYGATARRLARERGARVIGLTVSPAQLAYARGVPALPGDPEYRLEDWLRAELPAASADAVLAVESVSHMADPARAFAHAARVLRPGGRLVVCDWLAAERRMGWRDGLLLEPICREGRLPAVHTGREVVGALRAAGLEVELAQDLSRRVSRTWTVCLRRTFARLARDREARGFLLSSANPDRVFALTMLRLVAGFATRGFAYGLFVAHRPPSPSGG